MFLVFSFLLHFPIFPIFPIKTGFFRFFCGFPFDLGKFDLGIPHIPHIPEIFDLGKFDLGIPHIPDIPHIPEIYVLGIFQSNRFFSGWGFWHIFLGGVFGTTWARTPIPYTTPSDVSQSFNAKWFLLSFKTINNRPYSYSHGWTGTSVEWRLMRENLFRCKLFYPHNPPLHARSSPTMGIRTRSIDGSYHL